LVECNNAEQPRYVRCPVLDVV